MGLTLRLRFEVTGTGVSGPLSEWVDTAQRAAYLAAKMADQGVADVRVFDFNGQEVDIADLRASMSR